jgi:methionyl-tRNA formyltransferase
MIIFFGSSKYSILALKSLLKQGYHPIIITTPDKPAGRHQQITPNPLASFAKQHNLLILKPEKLGHQELQSLEKESKKAGFKEVLGVCCVYGKIIPKEWLEFFPKGIINIHPSLLPKYRGASPAQFAILAGEKQTGVSFIVMDEKIDHGPIIYQKKYQIRSNDTAESLYQRLFKKAATLLPWVVSDYLSGKLTPRPQKQPQATFTRLLKKEDGFVQKASLKKAQKGERLKPDQLPPLVKEALPSCRYFSPDIIDRLRRALFPWPGLYTKIKIKGKGGIREALLKIIDTAIEEEKLLIKKVQLAGKNEVEFSQFTSSYSW